MQPVIERRSLPDPQLAAFLPQKGRKRHVPLQFLERRTLLLPAQPVPRLHEPLSPQLRTRPHPRLMLQPRNQPARPRRTFQTMQRLPDLRLMFQRRPQICYADLAEFDPARPALPRAVTEQVEIRLKYDGYIKRQLRQVEDFARMEAKKLPPDLDYAAIAGLRLEAREKLEKIRPENFGQASRISGVSPADIAVLLIKLKEMNEKNRGGDAE